MATDVRVVVPGDIGETIKLGVREPNKYDVDFGMYPLPEPRHLTGATLQGTTLLLHRASDGDVTVDLASMLPNVVTEIFLKDVVIRDNQLRFTVGGQDNEDDDITLDVDLASLIPVTTDGQTIGGNGTVGNPLKLNLATGGNNLLKQTPDGVAITEDDIARVVQNNLPTHTAGVRLVNASGQTVLGYIHETENG